LPLPARGIFFNDEKPVFVVGQIYVIGSDEKPNQFVHGVVLRLGSHRFTGMLKQRNGCRQLKSQDRRSKAKALFTAP
jgi:hypothetical protein